MIVAIIVLQIIRIAIAAFTRHRLTDERDQLIELRGFRAGYLTIASLMVMGLGLVVVSRDDGPSSHSRAADA